MRVGRKSHEFVFNRSRMAASDKEEPTVPSLYEDMWKSYEYLDTTEGPSVSDKFHVLILIRGLNK